MSERVTHITVCINKAITRCVSKCIMLILLLGVFIESYVRNESGLKVSDMNNKYQ